MYEHACTDRTPRPKPPLPALGPAGFAFHDPAFGTLLVRVTDQTMGGSSFRVPSNAHLAGFNADATKFLVVGQTGNKVFAFDAAHGRATALADLRPDPRVTSYRPQLEPRRDPQFAGTLTGTIDVASPCEPCWSRTDPNVLYAVGGPMGRTIQAITFDGEATVTTDLLDLDTLGLALGGLDDATRTYVGGLVTGDWDLVVFFGGTGQDQHCYVGQLPIGGTAFARLWDTRQGTDPFLLHSVAAARARQFITLYPTQAKPYQTIVIDTVLDTLTPVTVSPGGHDALSYGWWVNADSGEQAWDAAQWQLRMLAHVEQRQDLITPVLEPKVVYLSEHSTWNNATPEGTPRQPVISSTFRFNNESAPWRALDDEVLAIATEGPSTVYRFCQHRSDSRDEANPASTYFWYQPIANVSPDGKWVLFTSNWEKTLGPDPADPGRSRQDVFLAQLQP